MSLHSTLSQTFWGRPVIEDVPDGFNTLALTADRRTAVFKSDKTNKKNPTGIKACAEALPDVAISSEVDSSLKMALKTAEQVLDVDAAESIKQALTVAYQKTEKSDLVRQFGWQICQSFFNNAISEADYLRLLETMVIASLVNTTDKKGSNILDLKALLPQAK